MVKGLYYNNMQFLVLDQGLETLMGRFRPWNSNGYLVLIGSQLNLGLGVLSILPLPPWGVMCLSDPWAWPVCNPILNWDWGTVSAIPSLLYNAGSSRHDLSGSLIWSMFYKPIMSSLLFSMSFCTRIGASTTFLVRVYDPARRWRLIPFHDW